MLFMDVARITGSCRGSESEVTPALALTLAQALVEGIAVTAGIRSSYTTAGQFGANAVTQPERRTTPVNQRVLTLVCTKHKSSQPGTF